ncbi:MAG: DVU_1557 family redox protein [Thermodesulfobacteriota bacterium]
MSIGTEHVRSEDLNWKCQKCDLPLEAGPVTVEYLGNQFTTDLPRCPGCGLVYISEDLAQGKMAEVEQILEDK